MANKRMFLMFLSVVAVATIVVFTVLQDSTRHTEYVSSLAEWQTKAAQKYGKCS